MENNHEVPSEMNRLIAYIEEQNRRYYDEDAPTISDFAQTLGISQPNATYKANNLAQKGYIKFNDVKPQMIFKYKQNKQGKITYAEVSFKMPDDYEFNEDDLEIKE